MSLLREKLSYNEFVITAEITPPKGPDTARFVDKLIELKPFVDAINFTDNPSAKMKLCSLAACKISLELGIEPVFQMTCRDRNRIAIQSDLLGAHALGIRNLLVMTGDHPIWGDHKEAKPVYDIDSSILVKLVNNLNSGLDIYGNKLNGETDFYVGAVINPNCEPLMPQLMRFEQKLQMGAKFFQTQMIFEIERLEKFIEYASKFNDIKVIVGVIIIKNKKMLKYIAEKVPGVVVPNWLIEKVMIMSEDDIEKFGIEYASDLILEIMDRQLASGVHIMAISRAEEVKKLLNYIKIKV